MRDGPELNSEMLDTLSDGVYFVDLDRRIIFWNRGAEKLTGIKRESVLGRRCSAGFLCHVDEEGTHLCRQGCPLAKTMEDGNSREVDLYFRHANGHRVPVTVSASPVMGDDGRIAGAVEVFRDSAPRLASVRRLRDLEEMAYTDKLTGLGNRRATERTLRIRHHEAARYGWVFGVLFIDLDHFKAVNDRRGHKVGDDILRLVARNLEGSLRVFDYAGRWGGEEFLALVVNVDRARLGEIAERCRMLIENSALPDGGEGLRVTVSIGAALARPEEDLESLIVRADALMYESKAAGRNRVTIEEPSPRPVSSP
jgi:diguanylate cyclase (GGDEF)-like protein/PAS domain S-box-containing protein